MKIKVCGMTDWDQVTQLVKLDVSYFGLIFYKKSPRCISENSLPPIEFCQLQLPLKIGVFVNSSYEEVMKKVDEYGLDKVQLHGNETPEECSRLTKNIPVIKAISIGAQTEISKILEDYEDAASMFLFDTHIPPDEHSIGPRLFGGTGKKFQWEKLLSLKIEKPFFLSGGIGPGDVSIVNQFASHNLPGFAGIDINSRFETSPGKKDLSLIKTFISELKILPGR